ncbi:glycine-rich RNA-binding protein GRP1A [Prunus yedoensis var. nudiflora]|uniref:Glycine-rich RNA-binding protein GRP1A n=1 Tax=Prunus yedoensis var. nudiflora TaxID=2094558 RepID=A0A314UT28_PRUYE|nr:glycine-rich RNA-binding protein GRP1A [Prunus yedoensis var. nudiflora]
MRGSSLRPLLGRGKAPTSALWCPSATQFLFNLIILSFVGGLAWTTDNDALERAFSPFGEIIELKGRLTQIINDRETGRSRGFSFGFVTFSNEKAMRDAIEGMNDQYLDGRNITINEAQSCGSSGGGNGDLVNNLGTIARVAPRN